MKATDITAEATASHLSVLPLSAIIKITAIRAIPMPITSKISLLKKGAQNSPIM